MDHRKAIETKATERYLLGEMTELEQHLFEEHYFSCVVCGEDVRTGIVFRDSVRSVFAEDRGEQAEKEEHTSVATATAPLAPRVPQPAQTRPNRVWQDQGGWFDWLRPATLIPMTASVSLAFIVAYQSLVVVPGLREMTVPAVATPTVLASATRGDLPVVTATASSGAIPVSVYLNGSARRIAFELIGRGDTIIHSGSGPAPAPGAPLVLFLPVSVLKQPGEYKVSLRDPSAGAPDSALGEFRFLVER